MKKQDIAKQLARESGVTKGEAADRLDRVVQDILIRLREGKSADLPGMGRFVLGVGATVTFRREREKK